MMHVGKVSSSEFSARLQTNSLKLQPVPFYEPQPGSKFLPHICTFAPLQMLNTGSMSYSFLKHFVTSLQRMPFFNVDVCILATEFLEECWFFNFSLMCSPIYFRFAKMNISLFF
jgi:hypothetical protein